MKLIIILLTLVSMYNLKCINDLYHKIENQRKITKFIQQILLDHLKEEEK